MDHSRPARPILSAAAVVVHEGRVLLIRRAKDPDAGEWSIPGGAVELGESLDAALRREVREETGLEVAVGALLEIYERVERDAGGAVRFHFVVVDYRCTVTGGVLRAGDDAADAVFAALDDLDRYGLSPDARRVIISAIGSGQRPDPINVSATRGRPGGPGGR